MADDGPKRPRMTEAEREQALRELVQRTTKLTDEEVRLLGEVWPILVRAHFPDVRRLVARRVPEHAVDDVVGATFLALIEVLLDGFPTSLRALGITVALRKCVDWLRDNAKEACAPLPSSSSEKPRSSAPGTEGLVALHELREIGEELRAMLSPEHQDAFDLHIVGDMSLTEAAAALGLSEGTFKSRVMAAKCALRAAWERLMIAKGRPPG